MQIDFLTLACFRDYADHLLGARVQDVILPDDRSVALELYAGRRFYLLVSASSQTPRILLAPEKPRRGVEAGTPMLLLLRKWVREARLADVTQPPWERVLYLDFEGRAGESRLVVELMGRYSNIILVGSDGRVLEAVKHVGPTMNRYRITLPAHPYRLPPPPPKRSPPVALTGADWESRLISAPLDEPLQRWLVNQLLGVSPVVGREIAARAVGDPKGLVRAATPQALQKAIVDLFAPLENGQWAPHVALDEKNAVVAFTAFEPRQFERVEAVRDINQAMWRYFEEMGMADPYAAARQAVQALIDRARGRLESRLEKIQNQVVDKDDVTMLRVAGELLLTYQNQVAAGAREVTLLDYAGEKRAIALDPKLTAVENAQAYFRRYEKAGRAADHIPALLKELEIERAYLEQLDADLTLAESRPEIDTVREALAIAGWASKSRQKVGPVSAARRFEVDGFAIYVGRNARQNDLLTFKRAGPEDFWLHVRGEPGAHVVIRRGRQKVPESVIQRAAGMAVFFSRARDSGSKVAVDVTERRFVKRLKGKYPGIVTYRNERTIWASGNIEDSEL